LLIPNLVHENHEKILNLLSGCFDLECGHVCEVFVKEAINTKI